MMTATDTSRIYACHLELQDYLVHREGKPFSREEYRQHPEQFESTFHEKVSQISFIQWSINQCTHEKSFKQIAPYTTLFLNGGFFSKGCPLLLSTKQLAELQSNPESRLVSIVDVSCDFDVSMAILLLRCIVSRD